MTGRNRIARHSGETATQYSTGERGALPTPQPFPSGNGNGPAADQGIGQPNPVIALQNLRVQYHPGADPVLALDELTISHGERVALIGPSGAGKTTLLRLLNGYAPHSQGRMDLLGYHLDLGSRASRRSRRSRAVRRRVGFVFQDFSLVERATVFQNVLWGRLGRMNPVLSLLGWFSKTDKTAAMEAIAEVDLLPQATQRVDTLSGGQQQRVGVARVVAQEAQIILADEPVSNLDPALADDILGLLSEVSRSRNATLIMSLHQPHFAQRYADRIVALRQGQIVYNGRADGLNDETIQSVYERSVPGDEVKAPAQADAASIPLEPAS